MNTTNTNQPSNSHSAGVSFFAGLALLIIGLLIGFFGSKQYWQKSAPLAMNNNPGPQAAPASAAQPAVNTSTTVQSQVWDPLQQMNRMQAEIDQVFQRSLAEFHDNTAMNTAKPGYSLTMDVRDLKDKYQVRAFLPDTKPADVKVNLNGDELKVDVANQISEKPTARNGETALTEWGNYEEVVRLAGPLKENQMTVQHLPHELVISVPKA